MNTTPIAPPTQPDMRALLDATKQQTMAQFNCHQVGSVVSFDATAQTVSVQLQMLAVLPDGSQVPYPVLTDCPVFINSGGGGAITFPIAAGDPCLVLFNDRDLDNWWATGNVVTPNSPRMHSLSDGLVLVGFRNKSNPIPDYSTTNVELRFGGSKVSVAPNGSLEIDVAGTVMTIAADGSMDVTTTGKDIRFQTKAPIFMTLRGSDGKLELFNGSTSLGGVFNLFSTAMTTWVNTGGSTPNAATIANVNAANAAAGTLLF